MPDERLVRIAMELQLLGVSEAGVRELLAFQPDIVEAQLRFLPLRKARRPEAFIIEAVRRNFSPPKEFFYAKNLPQLSNARQPLDQDAESPLRSTAPEPQRHRAQDRPGAHSS